MVSSVKIEVIDVLSSSSDIDDGDNLQDDIPTSSCPTSNNATPSGKSRPNASLATPSRSQRSAGTSSSPVHIDEDDDEDEDADAVDCVDVKSIVVIDVKQPESKLKLRGLSSLTGLEPVLETPARWLNDMVTQRGDQDLQSEDEEEQSEEEAEVADEEEDLIESCSRYPRNASHNHFSSSDTGYGRASVNSRAPFGGAHGTWGSGRSGASTSTSRGRPSRGPTASTSRRPTSTTRNSTPKRKFKKKRRAPRSSNRSGSYGNKSAGPASSYARTPRVKTEARVKSEPRARVKSEVRVKREG